jgi:hypothetical protein
MHLDPAPVPPGTLGIVWAIDALGTVHVTWDNGSDLGVVPELDRYERVDVAGVDPKDPPAFTGGEGGGNPGR